MEMQSSQSHSLFDGEGAVAKPVSASSTTSKVSSSLQSSVRKSTSPHHNKPLPKKMKMERNGEIQSKRQNDNLFDNILVVTSDDN